MTDISELNIRARNLSRSKRQDILMLFKETELHGHLKNLFQLMEPDYIVEITHGPSELGKDLVLVKSDRITTDVIGVVVKCGNISGRTLGEVDALKTRVTKAHARNRNVKVSEIESQIQQALHNPAELKCIFSRLPVNKISVVLAGKLSGNARIRIERELKFPVTVLDIGWLIENFTQHYPQVFFDGTRVDFIQSQVDKLEKRTWLRNRNLSDYFIEPIVGKVALPVNVDEDLKISVDRTTFSFSKLKSILEKNRRVILAGDPGTGKSAAVAKLAIDQLRDCYDIVTSGQPASERLPSPIVVTAQEMLDFEDVTSLVSSYYGQAESRFDVDTLYVDGLDETPAKDRATIIRKAKIMSDELSCALVITSRKVNAIETVPSGFAKYELLPFEFAQALKLISKVIGKDSHLIDVLKEGLEKIQFQMPIVPLSLLLLIELVREQKEVPSSVTELYDRFSDAILGREDKKKGIEVLFEYIVKKRFLASLAYSEFLGKGRLTIPRLDLEKFSEEYAVEYGLPIEHLAEFIREIERAGILELRETVAFVHRSFLDYFIALDIFHRRDEIDGLFDFLVELYFEETWQDVLFFFTGLKREISGHLLKKLRDYKGDGIETHINKFLVGRLLQAGWHSKTSMKMQGIKQAFGLAPSIKAEFLKLTEDDRARIPKIIADFFVAILSDIGFRSTFLEKEMRSFYKSLTDNPTASTIRQMPMVLWAVRPFLDKQELRDSIDGCLSALSKNKEILVEEEAGILLLLCNLELQDRKVSKPIGKRLRRIAKRYPESLRVLVPERKKGFRKKKRTRIVVRRG